MPEGQMRHHFGISTISRACKNSAEVWRRICSSRGRHSRRSASIGCTCAARRAGIQLEASATINSRPAALHLVIGSDDGTPKSTEFMNRAERIEAPTPDALASTDSDEASHRSLDEI